MFHIFIYDPKASEYVLIRESADAEFLKNLMNDPVWLEHDMCYLAW